MRPEAGNVRGEQLDENTCCPIKGYQKFKIQNFLSIININSIQINSKYFLKYSNVYRNLIFQILINMGRCTVTNILYNQLIAKYFYFINIYFPTHYNYSEPLSIDKHFHG